MTNQSIPPPPDWQERLRVAERQLSLAHRLHEQSGTELQRARLTLNSLRAEPAPVPVDTQAPVSALVTKIPPPTPPSDSRSVSRAQPPAPAKPPRSTEETVVRILAFAGTAVTVIGVGLAVALGVQNGWLGPVAQAAIGAVLAAVFLAAAVWVDRRGASPAGAAALVVTSILVALLAALGTTGWLDLIAPGPGVVLHLAAAAIYLTFYRLMSWPAAGSAVAAISLGMVLFYPWQGDFELLPLGWLLVLMPLAALASTWQANDQVVRIISAHAVALSALTSAVRVPIAADGREFIDFLLAIVVLTSTVALTLFAAYDPGRRASFTVTVIMAALVLLLAGATAPTHAWSVLICAVVIGLAVLLRMRPPRGSHEQNQLLRIGVDCAVPVTVVVGALRSEALLPHYYRDTVQHLSGVSPLQLWALAALLGVVLVLWFHRGEDPHRSASLTAWSVAVAILNAPWIAAVMDPYTAAPNWGIFLQALLTAAALIAAALRWTRLAELPAPLRWWVVVLGLALSMAVIVTLTRTLDYWFNPAQEGAGGFIIGHALVSVLWMSAGAWLLSGRHRFDPGSSLIAGLVLTAAAIAKLVVFDLQATSGVFRVLAFLVSGLVLLAVVSLRRREPRETGPGETQAADKDA